MSVEARPCLDMDSELRSDVTKCMFGSMTAEGLSEGYRGGMGRPVKSRASRNSAL